MDFFTKLSSQNPQTIIIIGPNHLEKGTHHALSSHNSWNTSFGNVEPNLPIIKELLDSNLMQIDEDVLANDQTVTAIMPFIKISLPDTRVVPILLSGFTTEYETQKLANALKEYINKDTVIIASVDFSHYLTNPKADEKDKITLEAMKNYNYRQILSFNSDYLDSPASIVVLLKIMQSLGTTNMTILNHMNSGKILKDPYIETTSYFEIIYTP